MSKLAVETLEAKRNQLVGEKEAMTERFDNEIRELDIAINALYGKILENQGKGEFYDDTNPDYIKNTEDGI